MKKHPEQNPIIKSLIALANNHTDVEILWLYGSRARNTANLHSDYDLAVAFKHYLEDPVERRLRPEMLALKWAHETGVEISVIDINQVPLPLAYTVVQDNCLLYSDNDYRKMIEEQKIMSKWELDYCYPKKHYA
ncbi:type VII toxin-antitoxin system MntA family adenylyltransferase antitoxin [methane-oxidizing endosymbiont of Gigantopelta aegis]|uniref:type VII toxin-antitoxin system MntA family adenylyltransferase antitoxin n=1 Tax=methane-oxidizing endosymbiont of Gigantopelta aegis TaxID=2794938 RepID=UPI0018DE51A1|nr:nucleotidyltransferase domain-containing protein [methane-oxidizing endosymbiont of Gigantopelta aegis]